MMGKRRGGVAPISGKRPKALTTSEVFRWIEESDKYHCSLVPPIKTRVSMKKMKPPPPPPPPIMKIAVQAAAPPVPPLSMCPGMDRRDWLRIRFLDTIKKAEEKLRELLLPIISGEKVRKQQPSADPKIAELKSCSLTVVVIFIL
ncbi:hypothetical protein H6P81_007594 [Aristolochia fimbriata]|uniref:Uncharacterized protein n=1 Tax=Aristolochia fimbriata TaxID=158543 RepID=A0AAV7F2Z0_ARIFI|nr:hypothetical protein H6P81_007594 [Aristolochia fimbriata]